MRIIYCLTGLLIMLQSAYAQSPDRHSRNLTLEECIHYALDHQPLLQQVELSEEITQKDIDIRVSDWLPQISVEANLQNNLKRPTSVLQIGDQGPQTLVSGTEYASTIGLSVNQIIFNNDVLLAGRTASDYKRQAEQNTISAKINLIVNVSKAYFQVLTTQQEVAVFDQTIERLEKNFSDARNRYDIGVSDKIDYKRAQIALNNSRAQRRGAIERYKSQKALLMQLMGYSEDREMFLADDVSKMETASLLDTTYQLNYANRIEYQLVQTQKQLSEAAIGYYKQGFIPTLSAYYNYNLAYLNNEFSNLYQQDFPNSVIGVRLSLPVFQGMRRIRNIQKSKLQYEQLEFTEENLQNEINTEYVRALGTYKTNLGQLQASRANYEIAEDVYNTVKLQYDEGIKAYLEVIVAESDLRTSQLNYLNALLNVLSSKLDVQKAEGTINITE